MTHLQNTGGGGGGSWKEIGNSLIVMWNDMFMMANIWLKLGKQKKLKENLFFVFVYF